MSPIRVLVAAPGITGPFAARLFAERGADVIAVEPPDGDWTRRYATTPDLDPHDGLARSLRRGMRGVTADLAAPSGRGRLRDLVRWADVAICGPELLDAGLGDEELADWSPSTVRCWVSNFGLDGSYSGYVGDSFQVLALGGISHITGEPGRPPLGVPGHHAEYIAGIHAFAAASAALLGRERHGGGGQRVEVSALEAVAASAEMATTMYVATGAVRSRFFGRQPWGIQGEVVPCLDGYIAVHPGAGGLLPILIDRPDLIDEPLLVEPGERLYRSDEFFALLAPFLQNHTRSEIMSRCEELGIPFGAVLTVEDLVDDEQLKARGTLGPSLAGERVVQTPAWTYRTSADPAELRAAPDLGEHDASVADALATPQGDRAAGEPSERLPLEGIRIVDLTWVYAGPSATRTLADLGADVIKIESPRRPDGVRALVQDGNQPHEDFWNRGLYFAEKNLGKRAITLDLAADAGVEIFLELIRSADIVIESFRPRVMEQFGLSFERLVEEQPRLIMASLSGYGQSGPYRNRAAYGAALEPEAGITGTIGYEDGPPVKTGLAYTDPISGALATGAIIEALLRRERGDLEGPLHIDLAEREAVLSFSSEFMIDAQLGAGAPRRLGNRHPIHVPQGCYPCAGDHAWIAVTVRSDEEWDRVAEMIGTRGLVGLDLASRREREPALHAAVTDFCASLDRYDAMRLFQAIRVPAAVVQDGRDLLSDPALRGAGFFFTADHPLLGDRIYHRFLGARFESWPYRSSSAAPLLDQHTAEVLQELGRSPDEIEALAAAGVTRNALPDSGRVGPTLDLEWLLNVGGVTAVEHPVGGDWPAVREVPAGET